MNVVKSAGGFSPEVGVCTVGSSFMPRTHPAGKSRRKTVCRLSPGRARVNVRWRPCRLDLMSAQALHHDPAMISGFSPLFAAMTDSIPAWLMLPFGLLLLLIATMPLTPPKVKHWWEHNYPFVALGLGGVVAAYYFFKLSGGGSHVGHTLHEYFSFIALIGSLFVVAGGIHIKVKGESTPMINVVFLAVGAVIANVIGTTGASMVLIRPWIRMNKISVSAFHEIGRAS